MTQYAEKKYNVKYFQKCTLSMIYVFLNLLQVGELVKECTMIMHHSFMDNIQKKIS